MGQIMGSYGARNVDLYMDDDPTFDPQAGFDYKRKPRGNILIITILNALSSVYTYSVLCFEKA